MNFSVRHLFSLYDSNVPFTVFSASDLFAEHRIEFNYVPYQENWLDKVCSTLGEEIVSSEASRTFLITSIDKYGRSFYKTLENTRGCKLREILKATFREPNSLRIELIENFEAKRAWIIVLRRDLF